MKPWRLFLALILCCGVGVGFWLIGCGDDDPVVICNDVDGDGYGNPISFLCTYCGLDCDDSNADVNPGETEGPPGDATCSDGLDNDCNGETDADDPNCQAGTCVDDDQDGYGDPASAACEFSELDCDDSNADVNPGETEGPPGDATCSDSLDNDCNGQTDAEDTQCQGGPATVTLSGKVLVINAAPPPFPSLAGATVALYEDPSNSTTSGGDGSWELEDVPADEDAFIKITAAGFAIAINAVPVSQGVVQYDLQILDPLIYNFLMGGAGPDACLVFGAVVGVIDEEYPQEMQTLAGATISVTPATLDVIYIADSGFPDASMTATGSKGAFFVVVPDANAITSVSVTGTRPGSQLEGPSSYPTLPGGFVLAGLVDTLFVP